MSWIGDTCAGIAVVLSATSLYFSKQANDRAATREKPPVYFQTGNGVLLLKNVGLEPMSALSWKVDDREETRALLAPGDWQPVGELGKFIFNAPNTQSVFFDYPSGHRWCSTLAWDGGRGYGQLSWKTKQVRSK